jgi:hypothetical protein
LPRLDAPFRSRAARYRVRRLKIGRNVARAVDALRRGWPVMIDGISFLAVETADEAGLLEFDSAGPADLLISGNRAVTLKLANQRDGVPTGPVRLARTSWIDLAEATAIADPAQDLRTPLKGPFRTLPLAPGENGEAALRLARLAGLLPTLFIGGSGRARASSARKSWPRRNPAACGSHREPSCRSAALQKPRSSPSAPKPTRPSMSRC